MWQEYTKRPYQSMFVVIRSAILAFYVEYETSVMFYYADRSPEIFCTSREHNYTFWAGKKSIFSHVASQHKKIGRRLPDF